MNLYDSGTLVVGFGFRARSGKDTAAAEIIKHHPEARQYSFAAELKAEVNLNAERSGGMHKLFEPGLRLEGCGFLQENGNIIVLPDWVQYDPDPPMDDPLCPYGKQRLLLQFWGTEFRRSVNPDYWVTRVAERITKEKPKVALITDLRFQNEIAWVQSSGYAVKVDRSSLPPLDGAAGIHSSELALQDFDKWDAVLHNDHDLSRFKTAAVVLYEMLLDRTERTGGPVHGKTIHVNL